MWNNPGLVERWADSGSKYIKNHGGHPDVTISTMRFSLQLWISLILVIILSGTIGLCIGTAGPTLTVLATVCVLRYFSGGWHFRSMDACVLFTTAIAVLIPLIPDIDVALIIAMNCISLILVLLLAPTGHGQKFKSAAQHNTFKWVAICIVLLSFIPMSQVPIIAILCQSFTLITPKGGGSR